MSTAAARVLRGPRSWSEAFVAGIGLEATLLLLCAAPLALLGGPDNPAPFLLGAVLQFPASALFPLMLGGLVTLTGDDGVGVLGAVALVAVLQTALFTFLFRKPWGGRLLLRVFQVTAFVALLAGFVVLAIMFG
jgi:hypothetical protein